MFWRMAKEAPALRGRGELEAGGKARDRRLPIGKGRDGFRGRGRGRGRAGGRGRGRARMGAGGWAGTIVLCLFLGTLRAAAQCTPASSGLISWWPGEGNAADIVFTNSGTLQGGATNITAFIGKGFSCDGSNGFVQIADSPSLRPTNLTIECWVRFSSLDSAGSGPAAGS